MAFQKQDLVGLAFTGFFQRNSELIRRDEEFDAERFKDDQIGLARRKAINETNSRQYRFDVWVLEYDPASGLFIARGKDLFGDSGLVGTIERASIEFTKLYCGKTPVDLPEDLERFSQIKYQGTITKPDRVVTCGGTYEPMQAPNYCGVWRLDSPPR